MSGEQDLLLQAVREKLSAVLDPETGLDVLRMKLVRELRASPEGRVSYIFRPSSPLCPVAVPLALAILQAIGEVPGVRGQQITVVDYIQAGALNDILASLLED